VKKPVIAVDGTAASGKGTLARRLAKHFNYAYLDTGLLYRAVGYMTITLYDGQEEINQEMAISAISSITPELLKNPLLRSAEVTDFASKIATMPLVRQQLKKRQQNFANNPPKTFGGAVLDGRDIGTVICPDANYKFFLDALIEVRAARRVKELLEMGVDAIHARVLQDMRERDSRDRSRSLAPLVRADDAFTLDTTKIDIEVVFNKALEFINKQNKSEV